MPEVSISLNLTNVHGIEQKSVGNTPIVTTKMGWPKWSTVLKQTVPAFEKHGWTDSLQNILIGKKFLKRDSCAEYNWDASTIALTDAPFDGDNVVETTRTHIFAHEMVHHRHSIKLFGWRTSDVLRQQISDKLNEYENRDMSDAFLEEVSQRASRNAMEAVAETGAALMQGYEYSDDIRRKYEILGGPEPIDLTRSENYGQPWPTTK